MRILWGIAIAGALWCGAPLHAQNGPVVARASSVAGPAVLTTPGAASLVLTPGYTLTPGDRVDTRGGGRVVIDLSDGSMVVVAPESVVVLKDYRMAGSLRELFEITVGAVRVKINHFAGKPNPYRMNSPTASIAVRGTEFTIDVGAAGETQVAVIEGLVEVTPLSDPANSVLLDAGRSVLVQTGQALRLFGGNQPPPPPPGNRDPQKPDPAGNQPPPAPQGNPAPKVPQPPPQQPQPQQPQPAPPQPQPAPMAKNDHEPRDHDHERDDPSPRGIASTYDRYLAGLTDIGQVPFLLRFNAFSEAHLDSIENPAYAGQFRAPEGRLLFLPTFRGARTLQEYQSAFGPGGTLPAGYSVSPQVSFFAPAGGFTLGGAASLSRIGDNGLTSNFYSGALIAARRFDANSVGLEVASLRGTGLDGDVTQNRFTAGYARNLTATTTVGAFYRYAFIDARDRDVLRTTGHSSEAGIRLRGTLAPRLSYGVTAAWLGISLGDAHSRQRLQRGSLAFGLGYALTDRTVFTFDVAGGSGRSTEHSRFASFHGAVQHDLTRHVFLSGSLLEVRQSHRSDPGTLLLSPYASTFSDFGAGWRFTRDLYFQYVYSTDYGVTNATHTLMLRWTFGPRR